jgi:RNA polymerase sigma-70 factor (ECF subfamily)
VTGGGFEAALRAAQQGDARAFGDLWRETNPAVTRYLEVVAPGRAGDLACESWVAALRRLSELEPTQAAWRSLVLGAAHEKADEEHSRAAWSLAHLETADDLSWSALADL